MSRGSTITALSRSFGANGEPIEVLTLLQILLDACEEERFALHEAMSYFPARAFKSRVRGFCKRFFNCIREIVIPAIHLPVLDAVLGPTGGTPPVLRAYLDSLAAAVAAVTGQLTGDVALVSQALNELGAGFNLGDPIPGGRIVTVRAMAQAIDDVYQDRFVPAFIRATAGSTEFPVQQGSIIPSKPGDPWYARPAYRLDRSDDHPGHLLHVRRIRMPLGVRLLIDTNRRTSQAALARFVDPQVSTERFQQAAPEQTEALFFRRIGFVCLGPSRNGFYDSHRIPPLGLQQHEYNDHERHPEDAWTSGGEIAGLRQFRQVHWKGHQKSFLKRVLRAAQQEHIDLLLLPELTLTRAAESFLRQTLRDLTPSEPRYPSLVIAGSRHVERDSQDSSVRIWRNQLVAFAASDRNTLDRADEMSLQHNKIGTFLFTDQQRYNVVEAIDRPRDLRVYLCNGILTCCLICKDVLQASVLEALEAAGVRRLIVVAMSRRVDEFAFHLSELAIRSNTHSWLVCATESGQITAGVFGPGLQQTAVLLRNDIVPPLTAPGSAPSTEPQTAMDRPLDTRQPQTAPNGFEPIASSPGSGRTQEGSQPPQRQEMPRLALENEALVGGRGLWVTQLPFDRTVPAAGWFRPIPETLLRGRSRR